MASEKLVVLPSGTYNAKLFKVAWATGDFKLSGTLDGFIDFAVPHGKTYPLNLEEAQNLLLALSASMADLLKNCLCESDNLLDKDGK